MHDDQSSPRVTESPQREAPRAGLLQSSWAQYLLGALVAVLLVSGLLLIRWLSR